MEKEQHTHPIGLLPKFFLGEATPEEELIIKQWLHADPQNQKVYDSFSQVWNLTEYSKKPDEAINLDEEWHRMEQSIHKRPNIFLLKRTWAMVASFILIVSLSYTGFRLWAPGLVKAPQNALRMTTLDDGTRITLNARSSVKYQKGFGTLHRNVILNGEAFFEVQKGNLPFVINSGEARVKVTGTKFNVKAQSHQSIVKVTVTEGTVELSRVGQDVEKQSVTAGETGLYDRSTRQILKAPVLNINDLAWKTGVIDFSNTLMPEVADIISNTYHVKIHLDPALQNCSVTVRFEHLNLQSVMNVLQSTLDLQIIQKGKTISIQGKGC
jgi:ferric-dicitrate binding protein FerR (iron transport regulator)